MNALAQLQEMFSQSLSKIEGISDSYHDLLGMIRPAQDPKFGDYQANCAMPLAGPLKRPAREIAQEIVSNLPPGSLCQSIDIAGPGFINLKLSDDWIKQRLTESLADPRLGVAKVGNPSIFVVDYSSPNVAKPMHVGHIRSTVIGDALAKTLRFVGHQVITDNHLGDWGTQFGMIIYGYKHFLDPQKFASQPVQELARLYKHVRKLMDYQAAVASLPKEQELLNKQQAALEKMAEAPLSADAKLAKQQRKELDALRSKQTEQHETIAQLEMKIKGVQQDQSLLAQSQAHPAIGESVLRETSGLHAGDEVNVGLWRDFLPHCRLDIQRIYQRLDIQFDHELGESFFQDKLQEVVDDLEARGFARTSEGAVCVFLDDIDTPMIVQKKDGAFLYATTDLATIKYRAEHWKADYVLYVVDHRQHEHFEKLFRVADLWGFADINLIHVSFGTVLGEDGKPFKTRSGDTVNLESLLDEAETRALAMAVEQNPELSEDQQAVISRVVGIGALKYADLSQNRASDYKFSYEKMLALKGNTATYLQYSFARVQGILRKLEIDPAELRQQPVPFIFEADVERALGLKLLQFSEALNEVLVEFKPNVLCNYLFELTQRFFQFYDQCSVKDAENEEIRLSRLQLCDLTARTIKQGLELLGIQVVDQM